MVIEAALASTFVFLPLSPLESLTMAPFTIDHEEAVAIAHPPPHSAGQLPPSLPDSRVSACLPKSSHSSSPIASIAMAIIIPSSVCLSLLYPLAIPGGYCFSSSLPHSPRPSPEQPRLYPSSMGRATPSALSPLKPPSEPSSAANKFFRHLPLPRLLFLHYNFTSLWLSGDSGCFG